MLVFECNKSLVNFICFMNLTKKLWIFFIFGIYIFICAVCYTLKGLRIKWFGVINEPCLSHRRLIFLSEDKIFLFRESLFIFIPLRYLIYFYWKVFCDKNYFIFFQNSKIRFDKDMVKDLCNIKFYNISLIDFSSYFLLRALYRIMLPFLSILYIVTVTISKVFFYITRYIIN